MWTMELIKIPMGMEGETETFWHKEIRFYKDGEYAFVMPGDKEELAEEVLQKLNS